MPTKSRASLLEHVVVPETPESRVCVGLLLRADLTTGLRGGKGAAACRESRQSMGVGSELASPPSTVNIQVHEAVYSMDLPGDGKRTGGGGAEQKSSFIKFSLRPFKSEG